LSELQKLKATLDGIASSAKQTGSSLGQFKSKFSGQMSQVQGAIGGSAQRKDQEVTQALQAASKQVDAAIAALEQAAKVAAGYGKSL
jgi:Sec-independent protein translocase protein TatA